MNRRNRVLVGLVLLFSMSVSIVETVWAATCVPDTGSMSAMPSMEGMEGMDDMPADSKPMPAGKHDRQQQSDNGPPCPFSPAGAAQGCAASALLPAAVAPLSSPSHTNVIPPPSDDASAHLLRTASIFHPPKL